MATTDNNLHVPDDLMAQAERLAAGQGRTADELAADALKRYIAHEWLNKLDREGQERRRRLGMKSDEDVERTSTSSRMISPGWMGARSFGIRVRMVKPIHYKSARASIGDIRAAR